MNVVDSDKSSKQSFDDLLIAMKNDQILGYSQRELAKKFIYTVLRGTRYHSGEKVDKS